MENILFEIKHEFNDLSAFLYHFPGLRIRIANLFFKLLTCFLYIFRVIADLDPTYATWSVFGIFIDWSSVRFNFNANFPTAPHSFGCTVGNKTEFFQSASLTEEEFQERPIINWDAILWVNRPVELWGVQLMLALISLTEALLLTYLGYKGNIWQQILSFHFILELVTTIPFALTVSNVWSGLCLCCYSATLCRFHVRPGSADIMATTEESLHTRLSELLAGQAISGKYVRKYFCVCMQLHILGSIRLTKKHFHFQNDLHRAMQKSQSALSQQLTILSATLLCLVFTRYVLKIHAIQTIHNIRLFCIGLCDMN